jgi:hypothetical protein
VLEVKRTVAGRRHIASVRPRPACWTIPRLAHGPLPSRGGPSLGRTNGGLRQQTRTAGHIPRGASDPLIASTRAAVSRQRRVADSRSGSRKLRPRQLADKRFAQGRSPTSRYVRSIAVVRRADLGGGRLRRQPPRNPADPDKSGPPDPLIARSAEADLSGATSGRASCQRRRGRLQPGCPWLALPATLPAGLACLHALSAIADLRGGLTCRGLLRELGLEHFVRLPANRVAKALL